MSRKPPQIPPGSYDFAYYGDRWWQTKVINGDQQEWRLVVTSFFLDTLDWYRRNHPGRVVVQLSDLHAEVNGERCMLELYEDAINRREKHMRKRT